MKLKHLIWLTLNYLGRNQEDWDLNPILNCISSSIHTHTHTHTRTHTPIHSHTYIHTDTHTHSLTPLFLSMFNLELSLGKMIRQKFHLISCNIYWAPLCAMYCSTCLGKNSEQKNKNFCFLKFIFQWVKIDSKNKCNKEMIIYVEECSACVFF